MDPANGLLIHGLDDDYQEHEQDDADDQKEMIQPPHRLPPFQVRWRQS
jgi:hypothetical protein